MTLTEDKETEMTGALVSTVGVGGVGGVGSMGSFPQQETSRESIKNQATSREEKDLRMV